jgi:hypothetical protein
MWLHVNKYKYNLYVYIYSDAAYGLMHSKFKLFQFNSNNAVLQFILEVTNNILILPKSNEVKQMFHKSLHYIFWTIILDFSFSLLIRGYIIIFKSLD